MSHTCPRCGLFSPEEAIRCDCGYDFKTRTVQSSYLVAHVLEKHGGAANILGESAKSNIRSGTVLLAIGAVVSVVGYLTSGTLYVFGAAVLWGALLLYRGLRQRRLRQRLVQASGGADVTHR
jgi:uncharacterized membrane protein YvbJ